MPVLVLDGAEGADCPERTEQHSANTNSGKQPKTQLFPLHTIECGKLRESALLLSAYFRARSSFRYEKIQEEKSKRTHAIPFNGPPSDHIYVPRITGNKQSETEMQPNELRIIFFLYFSSAQNEFT